MKISPSIIRFLNLTEAEQQALQQDLQQARADTLKIEQSKIQLTKQTADAVSYEIPAYNEGEAIVPILDRLSQLVRLTDSKGVDTDTWLVLGEVVFIHIHRDLIRDGLYDTAAAAPIMRGGGAADYFRLDPATKFQMWRPKP